LTTDRRNQQGPRQLRVEVREPDAGQALATRCSRSGLDAFQQPYAYASLHSMLLLAEPLAVY
jgi:hypothetical protein